MSIYSKPYINKNDYLLYKLEEYDLSVSETLVILIINFYNEHHIPLNNDILAKKLKIKTSELSEILKDLMNKKYLEISFKDGEFNFDLSKLYDVNKEISQTEFNELFKLFETVFNRNLNTTEMTILNELMMSYDKDEIIKALREAEAYQNGTPNIYYVKGVLANSKDD